MALLERRPPLHNTKYTTHSVSKRWLPLHYKGGMEGFSSVWGGASPTSHVGSD
eukprot:NODE_792_length_609_cov_20.614108_g783_i0.p1 GENE.NODE_792_length_609_cov_20.614108_g783_i0~~NODE_792_length_609_cov_20.614108_g783_i0.p1  ORF type:complete len:53 (-),score=7.09 NODE_792_length_609_cov_20.614108_g783_i0:15-173(-)